MARPEKYLCLFVHFLFLQYLLSKFEARLSDGDVLLSYCVVCGLEGMVVSQIATLSTQTGTKRRCAAG